MSSHFTAKEARRAMLDQPESKERLEYFFEKVSEVVEMVKETGMDLVLPAHLDEFSETEICYLSEDMGYSIDYNQYTNTYRVSW